METLHKLSLALQQRFTPQTLFRKREMDLVMLDREQVEQYNRGGTEGGLAVMYQFITNALLKVSPLSGEALDICCGPAQLMLRAAQAMPKMYFTGLDLSSRMLQFAEENRQKMGIKNASFCQGSMYELDKTFHKKFDLITWCDAMHHCDHEENVIRVLDQIPGLLKDNGCFLLFDFIRPKTGKIALELSTIYAKRFGDWLFQDNLDSYKAAFTFEETEEILRGSKLKNWRHIQPVICNVFQFVVVSPTLRKDAPQVSNLKYLWQNLDYGFMKVIFAGRI